jgi:prolyl 4-hydroxylase
VSFEFGGDVLVEKPGFLEPSLATDFIHSFSKMLVPATTGLSIGLPVISDFRTSKYVILPEEHELVVLLKEKLSKFTQIPAQHFESIQFVKYSAGEAHKAHYDFFSPADLQREIVQAKGGQRLKTVLIYLNDGFLGGETEFPLKDEKITPQLGKLVLWDSLLHDGSPDLDTLHSSLPVESGEKYVLVVWARERPATAS